MRFQNHKKTILSIIFLIILISLGGWFFYEEEANFIDINNEKDNREATQIGNLMHVGEEGWFLSYEKEGAPGLVMELNISSEEIDCTGDAKACELFSQQEKDALAGRRVEVKGKVGEFVMDLSRIEFLSVGENHECDFDFSDFKVEVVDVDQNEVDFSTEPEAESFRTRIEDTVRGGVNFAGHYAYAEWGSGTNYSAGAIVDLKNGEIVEFGLVNSHGADFKRDSRLLIINPPEAMEYIEEGSLFYEEKSKYFLMQEGNLFLLCED